MSDDSADSTVSDEEDEAERRVTRGGSFGSGMARRLRALFCCVLKRKPRAHEVVECDPDEYDYVVEKLIVRRVPVALIAIPTDLADGASRSMSSSTLGAKRASMKIKTNKTLRFEDELQDSTGGRQLFAENISEATSSTKTDVSSRTTSSMTVQDDISTRNDSTHYKSSSPLFEFENETKSHVRKDEARNMSSERKQDKFVPRWNQKYIVSPFRVQRGSFDLTNPKEVIGDLVVNGKSLSYIEESHEGKSSEPMKNVKNRDLTSNTAVRWRITVKRQRANATSEHPVFKERKTLR